MSKKNNNDGIYTVVNDIDLKFESLGRSYVLALHISNGLLTLKEVDKEGEPVNEKHIWLEPSEELQNELIISE